jgi:putative transposase
MPRRPRIIALGLPHHITQRGNFKEVVFESGKDYEKYIAWLGKYSGEYGLTILAYCLMPNHVHFIAIPKKADSLARTFNTAHMRYAQYLNKKMRRSGHVWQGRFFSCVVDQGHLIMAARYIERNPVRAGLVSAPWEWKWSSARAHVSGGKHVLKMGNLFDYIDMSLSEWKKYISTSDDKNEMEQIQKHTLVGRPLGNGEFIEKLQSKLGLIFSSLHRGRPRKEG